MDNIKKFSIFVKENMENMENMENTENYGKILHLTLKGDPWFHMIASGEKKEEYREIKPYWEKRLDGREYDTVKFRWGYRKDSPVMYVEYKGVEKGGQGVPKWGWDSECYRIKLGKIIKTENYEQYKKI